MSADIRAAVLLDSRGERAAASETGDAADRLADGARELLERADGAAGGSVPGQVEVLTPRGGVFALRADGWSLIVVAPRVALSSLMFYDMRSVLAKLEGAAA